MRRKGSCRGKRALLLLMLSGLFVIVLDSFLWGTQIFPVGVLPTTATTTTTAELLRYLDQPESKLKKNTKKHDEQASKLTDDELLESHLVNCQAFRASSSNEPNLFSQNHTMIPIDKSPSDTTFYVSIHPKSYDNVRWFLFDKHRYYEYYTEHAWKDILQRAPQGARILDVGGNIGYYSLYSAALGSFAVEMFEPNSVNLLRACESMARNGWDNKELPNAPNIHMWNWGVSDAKGAFWLAIPTNPGASRIVRQKEANQAQNDGKVISITKVDTITLDDFARARGWLDSATGSSVRMEILKIDVEHHEANVLLGARQLLQRQVVQHVFVEAARTSDQVLQGRALQSLIEAGYTWCGWGGFQGAQLGNVPTEAHDWPIRKWSDRFYDFWTKQPGGAVNLWFQIDKTCGRNLFWTFHDFT